MAIRSMNGQADRGARPLRVAVDLSNLRAGGENGGIKPFMFETLRWLGRQRRVRLQFVYLTCSGTHADILDELARVEDEVICVRQDGGMLPRGDERAPRERLALPPSPALLWETGADVLYSPFASVQFAWPGVPTICTIVDVLHRDFPYSLEPQHVAQRERDFQRLVAVADRLQCNSVHVMDRMREHYGVPAGRMFTVYNAVHARFGAGSAGRADGNDPVAGWAKTAPFFFYPANTWKHKNHEALLLAYGIYRKAALASGERPWPLWLTGHEDARWEELRALAGALDLLGKGSVRFLGYVSTEELAQLWRSAGALVFPSLHEGFGIPLLEAMEHDVPIVCSPDGSLPEVGGEEACLYVDSRNPEKLAAAMTRMASDEGLRKQLVAAGRRRLRDFSQDREMGRLLDALVAAADIKPPWRPKHEGVSGDGWTGNVAMMALPEAPAKAPRARLTLQFLPIPQPRRVRLTAGGNVFLGGYDVPAHEPASDLSIEFRPAGGPLRLEVPNAANLDPSDSRLHGVRLRGARLQMEDGREFDLLADDVPGIQP